MFKTILTRCFNSIVYKLTKQEQARSTMDD